MQLGGIVVAELDRVKPRIRTLVVDEFEHVAL